MKTYVVTGSTGLIGGYLCRRLEEAGCRVIRVVRGGKADGDGGETVRLDLSGPWDGEGLPERVDHVIYLAQSDGYRDLPNRARDLIEVNVLGAVRLAEYAVKSGAESFVYASTGSVYRPHGRDEVIRETSQILGSPTGLYAWSKLCAEAALSEFRERIPVSLLRFFFVYGKGGDRRMLIPRLADRIRSGEPIEMLGERGFLLTPTFGADAAEACVKCADARHDGVHNVAGGETVWLRGLCMAIGDAVGREPVFVEKAGEPVGHFRVGQSGWMSEAGMELTPLREGLRQSFE